MIQNIKYISIYINTQRGVGGPWGTRGFLQRTWEAGWGCCDKEFLTFVLNDKSEERRENGWGGDTAGTPGRAHTHTHRPNTDPQESVTPFNTD